MRPPRGGGSFPGRSDGSWRSGVAEEKAAAVEGAVAAGEEVGEGESRGGGRGGGMKGGRKVVVQSHRHDGVFIVKGKEDALCTKNMVPGESAYGEKRVSVQNEDGTKVEYRIWNPFRSKLAAAVLSGADNIWIAKILGLNASYFLKNGGHFVISIKANCIDSAVPAEAVFAQEVEKLMAEQFKPSEQETLEPFERDHACVIGGYRIPKKQKVTT